MNTNYDELLPKTILFSIRNIHELGIMKSDMCRKLLFNGELEKVKVGSKNFITRTELIRYFEENTIARKIDNTQDLESA